jgi:hypothetical protein
MYSYGSKLFDVLSREYPEISFDPTIIEEVCSEYIPSSSAAEVRASALIERLLHKDFRPFELPLDHGELASILLELADKYPISYKDDGEFTCMALPTSNLNLCIERIPTPNRAYFKSIR